MPDSRNKTYHERHDNLLCPGKLAAVLGRSEQIPEKRLSTSWSPDGDVVLRPGDIRARNCKCALGSLFAESMSVDCRNLGHCNVTARAKFEDVSAAVLLNMPTVRVDRPAWHVASGDVEAVDL